MDNPEIITVLSLCSGYGGLEFGLARALANPLRVVAVEIEAYALANLVAKAEEGKLDVEVLWPDLRTFPAERFRGCFDFVLAGYPCQPFSVAGKRQGAEDPRYLWPAIARIVASIEPLWCFFENVPGHLSLGFPDVYRSLRSMGYSIEAGLFTAAECGAPHKRQRLFILAKSCRAASSDQDGQTDGGFRQEDVSQGNGSAGTVRLGAASQLADSKCLRPAQSQRCECEQRGRAIDGGQAMADAERPGTRPGILQEAQTGIGGAGLAEQCTVVADAGGTEFQGRQGQRGNDVIKLKAPSGSCSLWPSRPGEPQYEWEEPRVLGDASGGLSGRRCKETIPESSGQGNADRQWEDGSDKPDGSVRCSEEQTESELG